MMLETDDLLHWARFVATKFISAREGWKYTRNLGNLHHIRFKSDFTGHNVWWRRILSGIRFGWEHSFSDKKSMFSKRPRNLWQRLQRFWIYFLVRARKDKNLPDGLLNGNPVFWEEDGEYGVLFGPTVGVEILNFLEAEPNNPHAMAIVEEMKRMAFQSFPGEETEDESS